MCCCLSPRVHATEFWHGKSGGFTIAWSNDNLVAKDGAGKIVYSAKAVFDKGVGNAVKSACADTPRGTVDEQLRLLSVVGPVLSVESFLYWDGGGAHPNLISRYFVTDLRRPDRSALLTEYFDSGAVAQALRADRLAQQRLAKRPAADDTLDALIRKLQEGNVGSVEGYSFGTDVNDFLSRFAFHHLEGDQVALRIGLSHGAEVYRGKLTQLGLRLLIPPTLQSWLAAADQAKEGFLMKRAKADRSLFDRTEVSDRSSAAVTTFSVSCK